MRRNQTPAATVDREDLAQEARAARDAATGEREAQAAATERALAGHAAAVQSEAPAPKPAPTRTEEDGKRLFEQRMRQLNLQRAANLKAQALHAAKGGTGMPPQYALPRRQRTDPTATPLGPDGKPYGEPHTLKKWVQRLDMHGREDKMAFEIQGHEQDGYRIVRDENGAEIVSGFGVLMEIDPELAAERVIDRQPAGAVRPEDYFASQVEFEASQANAAAGMDAMRVTRDASHGSRHSHNLYD